MDLQATRTKVMESEDLKELYNVELDLTDHIAILHKSVMTAESTMEQCEYRGKLSISNALLGICRERQQEVKDIAGRINYNFRTAAKIMLKKETYQALMEKAQLTRRQVKSDYKQLSQNKFGQ